ncbi:unnamed protein product [Parnassius apollo]|uniref:(apollo) hypothetical protein n=1 Tax=Parnassius apollo TaxID=110799 RepID=A0A8S3XCF2_PARAO|nr:unnamed protein product [Parnassius apollo]
MQLSCNYCTALRKHHLQATAAIHQAAIYYSRRAATMQPSRSHRAVAAKPLCSRRPVAALPVRLYAASATVV